jgi:RimJ/RimL family protein N-acetyltransferase
MQRDNSPASQPRGVELPDWTPPPIPPLEPLEGSYCRVEPLSVAHADSLHAANALDHEGRMWAYLPYGPFDSPSSYCDWVQTKSASGDPMFLAIVERASQRPVGVASNMRIDPANGSIEVGHLAYSPLLQRSAAATETMHLMMERAFALGYRRYEWKCDVLNAPSRAAAERFGFTFEGIFRQAAVVKGRNRDTAWYSVVDHEWPALKSAFERWLESANFDEQGRQRTRLVEFRR